MDYQDFVSVIAQLINTELSKEIRVEETSFMKNNGVCRRGITFYEKDINASPTIYLENFYDSFNKGVSIDDLIQEIISCYYKNRLSKGVNIDFFSDYEVVSQKIFARLINTELNKEFLEDVPHEEYLDMSVIVYCNIDDVNFTNAMVTIHNKHLEMWGISDKELIEKAKENTLNKSECIIQNIASVIKDMFKMDCCMKAVKCDYEEDEDDYCDAARDNLLNGCESDIPMYVATNRDRMQGAVYMIFADKLREFSTLLGGDYVILPSSIHEIILVPADEGADIDTYNSMVREVNLEHLEREEILSDHAYYYSAEKGFLI